MQQFCQLSAPLSPGEVSRMFYVKHNTTTFTFVFILSRSFLHFSTSERTRTTKKDTLCNVAVAQYRKTFFWHICVVGKMSTGDRLQVSLSGPYASAFHKHIFLGACLKEPHMTIDDLHTDMFTSFKLISTDHRCPSSLLQSAPGLQVAVWSRYWPCFERAPVCLKGSTLWANKRGKKRKPVKQDWISNTNKRKVVVFKVV